MFRGIDMGELKWNMDLKITMWKKVRKKFMQSIIKRK